MTAPVLKLVDVAAESGDLFHTGLWSISFELGRGDLMLVLLEREHEHLPLADAAEGLEPPTEGSVMFLGEDWQSATADRAADLRGKIGRAFEDEGWVSELDVDENIMLGQRHHKQRNEEEIRDEALKFARLFGLPGLPRGRPGSARHLDLRKAACVRAFLGQPALIILELAGRGVYADLMAPLVNAVQSARKRGAAVLWTASELEVWNNPGLRATLRGKMFGSQMHMMDQLP